MPLCLNPKCQKRIPSATEVCQFCGGSEIAQFDSYSKQEGLVDKFSMENFQRVIKNSDPIVELTIFPSEGKVSRNSRIMVRLQYFWRKLFLRNNRKK